jgi:hypothetical protein
MEIDMSEDCGYDYQAMYEALREVYRQQHPRITHEAIDAFVYGIVAGGGVAAGPEPESAEDSHS